MGGSGDTIISIAPVNPATGLTGMLRKSFAFQGEI
jgi:hypothetical protein